MQQLQPDNNRHQIVKFTGEYEFLSNFFVRVVMFRDRPYKSAEHAFQAAKAGTDIEHDLVMNAGTPRDARKLGQSICVREDWEQVKLSVMEDILTAKFQQHQDIWKKLLATKPRLLIEGNTWSDVFWGAVYQRNSWQGENNLGKLLMKIRDSC